MSQLVDHPRGTASHRALRGLALILSLLTLFSLPYRISRQSRSLEEKEGSPWDVKSSQIAGLTPDARFFNREEIERESNLLPVAIARTSRVHPTQYDLGPYNLFEQKTIQLNRDDGVLLQFESLTGGSDTCAIRVLANSSDITYGARGPQNTLLVWRVSLPEPLQPTVISHAHRPPRQGYLGFLDMDHSSVPMTQTFECSQDMITIELQCLQWQCDVEFAQAQREGLPGIILLQSRE